MERQIKFRAFVRGYMVNVVSIDFVNQFITWDDNQYDRCVPPNKCYEIESFDEIKLMQNTGLPDKNGIEIFEGDLLRTAGGILYEVVFSNGAFQLKLAGFAEVRQITNQYIVGIIGNIYSNPELIKPK